MSHRCLLARSPHAHAPHPHPTPHTCTGRPSVKTPAKPTLAGVHGMRTLLRDTSHLTPTPPRCAAAAAGLVQLAHKPRTITPLCQARCAAACSHQNTAPAAALLPAAAAAARLFARHNAHQLVERLVDIVFRFCRRLDELAAKGLCQLPAILGCDLSLV
eukprot:CAMPEP_0177657298 /NCGR_PEP_ID=MMETSP0447-20121125/16103_1 /TAXON_ID=0 /ORGANISM="Stygamoeba regulata, Strain BSH-02190019" /LENGTH=158 /DNA_ID=CAMNT_0019161629 /DNA_START=93 /DNA_END=573 /DNA_ORIENTATION=+